MRVVLKVRVNGLYETGNVTGFKEFEKDPLKGTKGKQFCAKVVSRDNILQDSIMFCSSIHASPQACRRFSCVHVTL